MQETAATGMLATSRIGGPDNMKIEQSRMPN
jgi:hypothetical protein